METLAGRAPAKVNWGLRILDRRPDGYHELRTVFQTVSLFDRLRVGFESGRRRSVELTCSVADLSGPENLAAQAARRLLGAGPWRGKASISIEKRIPHGSGLGGGSSDAAAVLRALSLLLRPEPPPRLLRGVAAEIGSDVPFFLAGGRALGVGRGEEVYPLPEQPRRWLVILAPETRIATAEAYAELGRRRRTGLTPQRRRNIIDGFCSSIWTPRQGGGQDLAETVSNDFEEIAFRKTPILRQWKRRLAGAGASWAMLSGSGSALFGVFDDRRSALDARESLADFPGKVFAARTLSRRSCRSLWSRGAGK